MTAKYGNFKAPTLENNGGGGFQPTVPFYSKRRGDTNFENLPTKNRDNQKWNLKLFSKS